MNERIVVIGGSAGSLTVATTIVRGLMEGLNAAIFLVTHGAPRERNFTADLLDREGRLPARQATEGEHIEPGRIYLSAPDRHLVIARGHLHLPRGPKEGMNRPSINVTFRSAAESYGNRVVGVLLSGMLDDGAAGLWEIAKHGGVTIVQDPDEAVYPSMPRTALREVPINYKRPAAEIAALLNQLASGEDVRRDSYFKPEDFVERYSGISCPECRGPLSVHDMGPVEFRCRVGHAFSLKKLIEDHTSAQENKLYEAILVLEEGAGLAEFAMKDAAPESRPALKKEADQLREHAAAIRRMIEERPVPPLD
jgi:two-component system chemotaxis response regulator CheB